MREWLADFSWSWAALGWGAMIFILTFSVSLLLVGFVFVRLPATYFSEGHVATLVPGTHPALRWTLRIGKNLLGVVLVIGGVIMFFTPGQGLLTVLVGVLLLDFPGKRWLETKIIGRPHVLQAINALRARYGKPPLVIGDGTPVSNAAAASDVTERESEPKHVLSRH